MGTMLGLLTSYSHFAISIIGVLFNGKHACMIEIILNAHSYCVSLFTKKSEWDKKDKLLFYRFWTVEWNCKYFHLKGTLNTNKVEEN